MKDVESEKTGRADGAGVRRDAARGQVDGGDESGKEFGDVDAMAANGAKNAWTEAVGDFETDANVTKPGWKEMPVASGRRRKGEGGPRVAVSDFAAAGDLGA